MAVTGKDGVTLDDVWARRPRAYMSMTISGFPNLFMINGPSSPVGDFSLIDVAERQIDYILKLVAHLRDGRCPAIDVLPDAMADFDRRRVEAAGKTIWATGCRSWYLDPDGVPTSWPWTYDDFADAMGTPKLEDYAIAG